MARLGIVERLYCEIHLTVEPMVAESFSYEDFAEAASEDGHWKASKFEHDDVDNIEGKWFLTARADTQAEAMALLLAKVEELREHEFVVLRAKIEDTVFDTKHGDKL